MDFKDFENGFGLKLIGGVIILALLLTLVQVLQNAVHTGAKVNAAYAQQAETQWRCNSAHSLRERDDCIAQREQSSSSADAPLLALADTRAE